MPTVATKTAKANFFDRLDEHGRVDITEALTQYRSLVREVARDPTYEYDPATAGQLFEALRITAVDMQQDVATLAHEQSLSQQYDVARAQSLSEEARKAIERAKELRREVLLLEGKARANQSIRMSISAAGAELTRLRQSNARLYAEPAEVAKRLAEGKPTGPRAGNPLIPAPIMR